MEYTSDEDREEQLRRIGEHMRTPIEDVIAEERMIAVVNGKRWEVVLQIGRTYAAPQGEYRCPAALWGLEERYSDIPGEGSLQALSLAHRFVLDRVIDRISSGTARFYYPGYEDKELTASFIKTIFGMVNRRPRKPKPLSSSGG